MIGLSLSGGGIGLRHGPRLAGGGSLLPFSDTFTRDDGALGGLWLGGSTWAIVSGKAVNMPTTVTELLNDGGLEATYTAGKCTTLTNGGTGTPTYVESADVHGGSKAQQFTATAVSDRAYWQKVSVIGTWYQFSSWSKRLAGAAGTCKVSVQQIFGLARTKSIISAAYERFTGTGRASGVTAVMYAAQESAAGPFDTIVSDDFSLASLSLATLFNAIDAGTPNVDVSAAATIVAGTQAGVVVNLDSVATPANFVIGYHDGVAAKLEKNVGGTYTTLVSVTTAYSAGAAVRVVKNGTSYGLYYAGSQVGTTQTISDAGIISNVNHGLFSTSELNTLDTFSVTAV